MGEGKRKLNMTWTLRQPTHSAIYPWQNKIEVSHLIHGPVISSHPRSMAWSVVLVFFLQIEILVDLSHIATTVSGGQQVSSQFRCPMPCVPDCIGLQLRKLFSPSESVTSKCKTERLRSSTKCQDTPMSVKPPLSPWSKQWRVAELVASYPFESSHLNQPMMKWGVDSMETEIGKVLQFQLQDLSFLGQLTSAEDPSQGR